MRDLAGRVPQVSDEVLELRLRALGRRVPEAGERPPEALDELVDWTALRDVEAERRPAARDLTPEEFAARTRKKITEMRKFLGELMPPARP